MSEDGSIDKRSRGGLKKGRIQGHRSVPLCGSEACAENYEHAKVMMDAALDCCTCFQGYKNTLEALMDPALKVHPNEDTPR